VPDIPGPSTADAADEELPDGSQLVIRLRIPLSAPTAPPPPDALRTRVVTEGGVYELDPHALTAVRLGRTGAALRRDGETLTMLGWPEPVVGVGMVLHLMVREDGVPTVRWTSPVLRVEPLDEL
jgi:hypothetical protein